MVLFEGLNNPKQGPVTVNMKPQSNNNLSTLQRVFCFDAIFIVIGFIADIGENSIQSEPRISLYTLFSKRKFMLELRAEYILYELHWR